MRTALILTTYNRPQCVGDTIASIREQSDQDWRLYIMDDGCDAAAREAIYSALAGLTFHLIDGTRCKWTDHGQTVGDWGQWRHPVVWWQGPPRTALERRATIPYSRTINRALNFLLFDERYLAYVCDDDWLMPTSVGDRAIYLDWHPEVEAVFGRLRSIRFGATGRYNVWSDAEPAGRVIPGRRWVAPTGPREFYPDSSAKTFYADGQSDPDTGLPYAEEGFWLPGPMRYGQPYAIDHNQLMHRRTLLARVPAPMAMAEEGSQYRMWWPEDRRMLVGDAPFFRSLPCEFIGIDSWTVTKRYHQHSDGVSDAPLRE